MTFNEWLAEEKGRAAALSMHLGKTPAAISQWKRNGVPVDQMRAVRDFTGGRVSLEEMVPGYAPGSAGVQPVDRRSAVDRRSGDRRVDNDRRAADLDRRGRAADSGFGSLELMSGSSEPRILDSSTVAGHPQVGGE